MPDDFSIVDAGLEKTRLLFRNSALAQAVVAINATLLLFLLGAFDPPLWALIWWAAAVLLAGLRFQLARRFFASCPDAERTGRLPKNTGHVNDANAKSRNYAPHLGSITA